MGICQSNRTSTRIIESDGNAIVIGQHISDGTSRRYQTSTNSPSDYGPTSEILYNMNPIGASTAAATSGDQKKLTSFPGSETNADSLPGPSRKANYGTPLIDSDAALRKHLNGNPGFAPVQQNRARPQTTHRYTPVLHDHSHHHTLSFTNPDNKNFEISLRFKPSGNEILGQFDAQEEPVPTQWNSSEDNSWTKGDNRWNSYNEYDYAKGEGNRQPSEQRQQHHSRITNMKGSRKYQYQLTQEFPNVRSLHPGQGRVQVHRSVSLDAPNKPFREIRKDPKRIYLRTETTANNLFAQVEALMHNEPKDTRSGDEYLRDLDSITKKDLERLYLGINGDIKIDEFCGVLRDLRILNQPTVVICAAFHEGLEMRSSKSGFQGIRTLNYEALIHAIHCVEPLLLCDWKHLLSFDQRWTGAITGTDQFKKVLWERLTIDRMCSILRTSRSSPWDRREALLALPWLIHRASEGKLKIDGSLWNAVKLWQKFAYGICAQLTGATSSFVLRQTCLTLAEMSRIAPYDFASHVTNFMEGLRTCMSPQGKPVTEISALLCAKCLIANSPETSAVLQSVIDGCYDEVPSICAGYVELLADCCETPFAKLQSADSEFWERVVYTLNNVHSKGWAMQFDQGSSSAPVFFSEGSKRNPYKAPNNKLEFGQRFLQALERIKATGQIGRSKVEDISRKLPIKLMKTSTTTPTPNLQGVGHTAKSLAHLSRRMQTRSQFDSGGELPGWVLHTNKRKPSVVKIRRTSSGSVRDQYASISEDSSSSSDGTTTPNALKRIDYNWGVPNRISSDMQPMVRRRSRASQESSRFPIHKSTLTTPSTGKTRNRRVSGASMLSDDVSIILMADGVEGEKKWYVQDGETLNSNRNLANLVEADSREISRLTENEDFDQRECSELPELPPVRVDRCGSKIERSRSKPASTSHRYSKKNGSASLSSETMASFNEQQNKTSSQQDSQPIRNPNSQNNLDAKESAKPKTTERQKMILSKFQQLLNTVTKTEIKQAFERISTEGKLHFRDFCLTAVEEFRLSWAVDVCKSTFKKFDRGKKKYITSEDFVVAFYEQHHGIEEFWLHILRPEEVVEDNKQEDTSPITNREECYNLLKEKGDDWKRRIRALEGLGHIVPWKDLSEFTDFMKQYKEPLRLQMQDRRSQVSMAACEVAVQMIEKDPKMFYPHSAFVLETLYEIVAIKAIKVTCKFANECCVRIFRAVNDSEESLLLGAIVQASLRPQQTVREGAFVHLLLYLEKMKEGESPKTDKALDEIKTLLHKGIDDRSAACRKNAFAALAVFLDVDKQRGEEVIEKMSIAVKKRFARQVGRPDLVPERRNSRKRRSKLVRRSMMRAQSEKKPTTSDVVPTKIYEREFKSELFINPNLLPVAYQRRSSLEIKNNSGVERRTTPRDVRSSSDTTKQDEKKNSPPHDPTTPVRLFDMETRTRDSTSLPSDAAVDSKSINGQQKELKVAVSKKMLVSPDEKQPTTVTPSLCNLGSMELTSSRMTSFSSSAIISNTLSLDANSRSESSDNRNINSKVVTKFQDLMKTATKDEIREAYRRISTDDKLNFRDFCLTAVEEFRLPWGVEQCKVTFKRLDSNKKKFISSEDLETAFYENSQPGLESFWLHLLRPDDVGEEKTEEDTTMISDRQECFELLKERGEDWRRRIRALRGLPEILPRTNESEFNKFMEQFKEPLKLQILDRRSQVCIAACEVIAGLIEGSPKLFFSHASFFLETLYEIVAMKAIKVTCQGAGACCERIFKVVHDTEDERVMLGAVSEGVSRPHVSVREGAFRYLMIYLENVKEGLSPNSEESLDEIEELLKQGIGDRCAAARKNAFTALGVFLEVDKVRAERLMLGMTAAVKRRFATQINRPDLMPARVSRVRSMRARRIKPNKIKLT